MSTEKQSIKTESPFERFRTALQADAEYARGWHDNLACAAMDENIGHEAANRIASRFMFNAFGIKTGDHVGIEPEDWPDTIG